MKVELKSRRDLPPIKKLNVQFDIQQLQNDFLEISRSKQWDGLMSEYSGLCENHNQLPPFFIRENEDLYNSSYKQLALSEFDPSHKLGLLQEKGNLWTNLSPKRNPRADERFYRKPIQNIPNYLNKTLDFFRPHLHRARFAKLLASSEVKPHIDYDTRYSVRLHIPIFTNDKCKMGIDYFGKIIEEHWPADGSVYFINQGCKHWATNDGTDDRVHLILSVESQHFL